MNKEVIWIVGFLLGICILSAKEKIGQIYLEVIDQPIVFGESVQLFCNLSLVPDCCSNTVTWMKNLDVIVHHGTSFNASKYAQIPAQTGFSLQINHFAETDLYAKFRCLYGFDEDSIVIGMEKNKYERHPSSDEIRINEHLDEKNNVFEIDILFERVLPMPSCILLSNDQDLKAQNVTKKHRIGRFYNVSIQLKLINTFDNCPNNITLKCYIGGYNMSHTVKNGIPCSVYLEVIDQPIVFGESVQLFCNLSLVPDCCSNTVTWMKNLDVIVHHGTSFDASKYAQIPAQTGFSLQINHFAETDLYAKFRCLYGFDEDSIVIGMEKNKYERYPSSDEIRINEYLDMKNNVFVIDIVFEGVLPIPSCILLSNDRDLEATVVIKKHNIGMFYDVLIQLKLNNTFDDFPNYITLKCSIGGYNISRALKHIVPCSEVPYNNSDHKNDAPVIIIICLLICFPLVVVIGILRLRHVYLSSKGQRRGERQESISLLEAHERGERQEAISLLEAHERGDRLESIETNEQDESLDSTALLETCEPGDRLESIETDEQGPLLESKASMETHEEMNKYNFIPMQKDRHVRKCLKLKKKKKKEKKLGPVLESKASMETHEQMNKYNYIPIQKDRQVRERLKLATMERKKENLIEGKKIPFLKEKLGKVE